MTATCILIMAPNGDEAVAVKIASIVAYFMLTALDAWVI